LEFNAAAGGFILQPIERRVMLDRLRIDSTSDPRDRKRAECLPAKIPAGHRDRVGRTKKKDLKK